MKLRRGTNYLKSGYCALQHQYVSSQTNTSWRLKLEEEKNNSPLYNCWKCIEPQIPFLFRRFLHVCLCIEDFIFFSTFFFRFFFSGRPPWVDVQMAHRLKIPHTFVIHTYTKPTKCHFCNKMLVGVFKQVGKQKKTINYFSHFRSWVHQD